MTTPKEQEKEKKSRQVVAFSPWFTLHVWQQRVLPWCPYHQVRGPLLQEPPCLQVLQCWGGCLWQEDEGPPSLCGMITRYLSCSPTMVNKEKLVVGNEKTANQKKIYKEKANKILGVLLAHMEGHGSWSLWKHHTPVALWRWHRVLGECSH